LFVFVLLLNACDIFKLLLTKIGRHTGAGLTHYGPNFQGIPVLARFIAALSPAKSLFWVSATSVLNAWAKW